MNLPKIAIIIPCYNEEAVLSESITRLFEVLSKLEADKVIAEGSFLYAVNDGSTDNTGAILRELHEKYPQRLKYAMLSRNFGNQSAIIAGLEGAEKYLPDCFITIDADLQQDETKIGEFAEKYKAGAQIVFGIKNDRDCDCALKKFTAAAFYKILNLSGVSLMPNHSEYRLISSKVAQVLKQYKETNIFLRGVVQSLGFKTDAVYFDVKPRRGGKSKFNAFSICALALNGITSFSVVPLRFVSILGFIMSLTSFFMGIYAVFDKYFGTNIVPGWATIVVLIGFLSGIQILCLGVIAEYLGQLFGEVKNRPRYIKESESD